MADKIKSQPAQPELLSHNYDGIREYDNSLPRWWVWQFWITVIFSALYVVYYHLGPGLSQEQQLAEELKIQAPTSGATTEMTEDSLKLLLERPEVVQAGKDLFNAKCMACHGDKGQGLVGPNLTDDAWVHGGSLMDIRRTILDGVPAKGMVPWKGLLTENEIGSVVAYIRLIRGTSPGVGKAPEGETFLP